MSHSTPSVSAGEGSQGEERRIPKEKNDEQYKDLCADAKKYGHEYGGSSRCRALEQDHFSIPLDHVGRSCSCALGDVSIATLVNCRMWGVRPALEPWNLPAKATQ